MNRRGTTRAVLLTGRWAVKMPRLRRAGPGRGLLWSLAAGLRANLSELEQTRAGAPDIAPVLHSWLGGLVQVYPRARPVRSPVRRYPARPDGSVQDARPGNLGILADRIVWIDYADDSECVACSRYRAS